MSMLKTALVKASGNRFVQSLLEKIVQASQQLMGIGSGGEVQSSGEQAIFHVLKERTQSPYCIFDVGSNKGQFLQLILENLATDEFSINCFEPGRATFEMLVESSNKDERMKLNNIGLGREMGEAVLHYDNYGSGLASLTKRRLDHFSIDFSKSEKNVINTIDNHCEENAIDHIHLLKIDIGYVPVHS